MNIDQFELVKERCTLSHVNVRSEIHGDEKATAYDLKFTVSLANSVLLKFHPELRDTFYKSDKQIDIEENFKPNLKFPLIGSIHWGLEIPRTVLRIHDIDGSQNDIVLSNGKTNKFNFQMLEGGTVNLTFRCQFSEADEDDVAKLLRALNQVLPISLSCEEPEEELDNFQQADLLSQEPMSEARKTAEELFMNSASSQESDDENDTEQVLNEGLIETDDENVVDDEYIADEEVQEPVKRGGKKSKEPIGIE